jgi:aromatic-L-amino-acid decarboxylase
LLLDFSDNSIMKDSLEALRRATARPLPHPDRADMEAFSTIVVDWLLDDFTELGERVVGRTASRRAMEALLREPAPEQGSDFSEVLTEFQNKVAPFAFRPGHPRFQAFIPGSPSFFSILGDWLCAGTNYFCGVWLEAAGPTQVELIVLDWFKEFMGYPGSARGSITSGGSEANLTALVVGRERLPFVDWSRAVLYQGEHRHWSVDRAAKIIGMKPDQVRSLPADGRCRLEARELEAAIAQDLHAGRLPWLVVANAGATNTGTVDPLAELADVCRRHNLWLHIDAAYGWPAVLTREGRSLLAGIEQAHSITLDPHKWFGQTFGAGCLLVREGDLMRTAFALRPEYMQDVEPGQDEVNFADEGIALTRRFRALKIWLSIKVLGVGWFRKLVEHCCNLAQLAQELLERSGKFEILNPRQLSIVCFRYRPSPRSDADLDELNLALCEDIRLTGRAFLSSTKLAGRVALRLCFVNWRTTCSDVEEVVHLLLQEGAKRASTE